MVILARALAPLLPLFIAMVVAACGGEASPTTGTAEPRGPAELDACALFPHAEATAELRGLEVGRVSGPLDSTTGKDFARCAYGYGPQAIVVAALEVRRHDSPEILRRKFDASLPLLGRLTKDDVEGVAGLGDVAWWAGRELRLLKVGWRDLELLITVQPSGDEPGFPRAAAERIARRALARLQEQPVPDELLLAPREVSLSPDAAESAAQ